MKLRIRNNTLRFRLTQAEVSALCQGESVSSITRFSITRSLHISLQSWNLKVADARLESHQLTVNCPLESVKKWADSEAEGMYFNIENDSDVPLELSVEKDYQCLKPREGEEDNFPHPLGGVAKC